MYFAHYEVGDRRVKVAAVEFMLRDNAPALGQSWTAVLIDALSCDISLRLRFGPGTVGATLQIVVDREAAGVEQALAGLIASSPLTSLRLAGNSDEFDRIVSVSVSHQLWLNQFGFNVGGRPVAADFRLLPLLDRMLAILDGRPFDLIYQVNLRRHQPDPEELRGIRRLNAALRVDPPFPMPLTNLQITIADRLLDRGFLSDEFLATADPDTFDVLSGEVARNFESTMGSFGFRDPPTETGLFDDFLVSGLHSSLFDEESSLLSRGAASWPVDTVRAFLNAPPPRSPVHTSALDAPVDRPQVFLSYSSKDFVQAMATARHLETSGISCWIAPRNISPGASYPDAIMQGIDGAPVLVAVVSDASNLSPQVHREIERALNRNRLIIPLRVQDILPSGAMEFLLSTCQWIDAYDPHLGAALNALTERVKNVLATG
jgi:hypothetical protein